jgi:hypothetical protein
MNKLLIQNPNYNQQDATFFYLFISTDALHVSDGSSAHHQEHITVHTASGILSLWFRASQFYTTIIQQDAAVRSQFYFTVALLYMFRVLSTPIIRSTLTVYTASSTGYTSVQLPSSNVAVFKLCHVGGS